MEFWPRVNGHKCGEIGHHCLELWRVMGHSAAVKTIIAAVDFSEIAGKVVDRAADLAVSLGAKLEILHVVSPEPAFVGYAMYTYPGRDERAEELRNEKAYLKNFVEGIQVDHPGLAVSAFMKEAPAAEGVLEFAEKRKAEIIVVGVHGKGVISRALLGSTSQDIVYQTKIPVLLIPETGDRDGVGADPRVA
jgi:nucleotide-binding universal stress UspA family protein